MDSKQRLLSEKEVNDLNEKDLKEYLAWLKEYKRQKLDELKAKKAALLEKQKDADRKNIAKRLADDNEELKRIRQEISRFK